MSIKRKRMGLWVTATLCLALAVVLTPKWGESVMANEPVFGGGAGFTQDEAIEISTAEQLKKLADDVNAGNNYKGKFIRLTSDIDLSAFGKSFDGGRGWQSIGYWTPSFDKTFEGVFDGNHKTVTGLYLAREAGGTSETNDKGLFGYIGEFGTVQDLTVLGAEVISKSYTGILSGTNLGAVINCAVSGTVKGDEETGGVAGQNLGIILSSRSNAAVKGRNKAGGIAGTNKAESTGTGEIRQSEFNGTVTGLPDTTGEIVGENGSAVVNCVCKGEAVGAGTPMITDQTDKQYVIYYHQGGNSRAEIRYFSEGATITLPQAERRGSSLVGWFTASCGGDKIAPGSVCSGYTAVYAHWENASYTVTFELNGGRIEGELTQKTYQYNDFYGELPDAVKKGYQFMGWFDAPTYGSQIVAGSVVSIAENHTVYAVYKALSFTVTFHTNGGSEVAAIKKPCGAALYAPDEPVKEGYTFAGWYLDESLSEEYKFSTAPDEDIALYAKWNKKGGCGGGTIIVPFGSGSFGAGVLIVPVLTALCILAFKRFLTGKKQLVDPLKIKGGKY